MKANVKKLICLMVALAITISAAMMLPDAKAQTYSGITSLLRIGGTDRFDTANRIAQQGWKNGETDTVFLASANNYADALAGAPLAYLEDAPILLVSGNKVPDSVMNQIVELGATNITILGGPAAVSEDIEKELENKNYYVWRIYGKDRYATSAEIAYQVIESAARRAAEVANGNEYYNDIYINQDDIAVDKIVSKSIEEGNDWYYLRENFKYNFFVVSGENYPDALSVSPIAALKGLPIIYSNKSGNISKEFNEKIASYQTSEIIGYEDHVPYSKWDEEKKDWVEVFKDHVPQYKSVPFILSEHIGKAYIIGGSSAVGSSFENNLRSIGVNDTERISGGTRYETSLMVTERFANIFKTKGIAFATGENYPDALAGGVFAAKKGIPILLLDPKHESQVKSDYLMPKQTISYDHSKSLTENIVAFINEFGPGKVYVLGGESVVPEAVVESYFTKTDKTINITGKIDIVDAYEGVDPSNVKVRIYSGKLIESDRKNKDVTIEDGDFKHFKVENGTGEMIAETSPDSEGNYSFEVDLGVYTIYVLTDRQGFNYDNVRKYWDTYPNGFEYYFSTYQHINLLEDKYTISGSDAEINIKLGEVIPR